MAYDETLYARFITGELTEEEIKNLKSSGEWDELNAIVEASGELTLPPLARDSFDKIKNKIPEPTSSKIRRINWTALAMAATLLLVAGYFFWFSNRTINKMAAPGENAQLSLIDGSQLTLNDGSSITFSESDWSNKRSIELTGEALFVVKKGIPFEVNTKNGSVEVLGTQFNVRAWGENLYVECYEGHVRVNSNKGTQELHAGEAVNFVNGMNRAKTKVTHQKPLWSTGTSRFYEEQLSEVFKELERQFKCKLEYGNASGIFSGQFRHDNLEEALKDVCSPMGLSFTQKGDNFVIQ